jgi:hypothetical protein
VLVAALASTTFAAVADPDVAVPDGCSATTLTAATEVVGDDGVFTPFVAACDDSGFRSLDEGCCASGCGVEGGVVG